MSWHNELVHIELVHIVAQRERRAVLGKVTGEGL